VVLNGGATNGRDLNGGRHRKLNRETRRGRGCCAEAVWVRRVRYSAIDSGRRWCMLGTQKEAEGREPKGRRCWVEVPALLLCARTEDEGRGLRVHV